MKSKGRKVAILWGSLNQPTKKDHMENSEATLRQKKREREMTSQHPDFWTIQLQPSYHSSCMKYQVFPCQAFLNSWHIETVRGYRVLLKHWVLGWFAINLFNFSDLLDHQNLLWEKRGDITFIYLTWNLCSIKFQKYLLNLLGKLWLVIWFPKESFP